MQRWTAMLICGLMAAACTAGPGSTLPPATTPAAGDGTTISVPPDERADERAEMVAEQIVTRGVTDPVVLSAMDAVPRHRFVPEDYVRLAYADHPLPIGYGQTISQPFIVALMSDALDVGPGDKVLEIGTGSGYQAAVLAAMGVQTFTIEIIPELASRAQATLSALGYQAAVRTGDGYFGWEDEAPFDGIIVTAAPDHVPQPLVEQLAGDGTMVIPVGPIGAVQTLWRFTLDEDRQIVAESLGPVSFVPFTRAEN